MSDATAPARGDNLPPLIDVDDLKPKLLRDWGHLFEKLKEFEAAHERWFEKHVVRDEHGKVLRLTILDDDDQGRCGDFLSQLNGWAKTIDGPGNDSIRAKVKEPVLQASRIIDGTFKAELADQFRRLAAGVHAPMEAYAIRKADEAKRVAEAARQAAMAEAARKEKEAQDLARQAAAKNAAPEALDAAIDAEQAALDAQHAADLVPVDAPKASDASRTYGTLGSVSSLRTNWQVEIVNADLLPREFMMPNMALLEAKMKSSRVKNGPPTNPPAGARYVEVRKLGNR